MPIYEFFSPDTNKIYSFLARRFLRDGELPRCPDGPKFRMERMISRFAVTGKAKEESGGTGEELDARQEAQMMQLAQQMENLGSGEADPREVGRLMRKMTEIAGEKMPDQVEEMVRRLEEGEDPESLEEKYGDVLDDGLENMDSGPESGDSPGRKNARRARAPQRDPALYELRDYL